MTTPAAPAGVPSVPDDLSSAGWGWEASEAGTFRLALPAEGLATRFYPPSAVAAAAFSEARERMAADAAAAQAERDRLSPEMRGYAEDVLSQAQVFIGRARAAQTAVNALGAGPGSTSYRPGPDAGGVYRRPPGMAEYTSFPARDLVDGRWQPREAYDAAALAELQASIAEHGVTTPLLALINEYGEPELIAGHRRKRAVLALDGRDVPVRILEVSAAQAFELAVTENDQRSDLSDVERGRAYERIIAEQGISEAELARRLGRPRAYIQQRRQLAAACPELQQAIADGHLSFTQARGLCLGSAGDHEVQRAVLKNALPNLRSGQTYRAEDLQRNAEQSILVRGEAALKQLGWKTHRAWESNTPVTFWFAATAAPARWTPAEVLAAMREGRRPPPAAAAPPLPLTKEDSLALSRRGWRAISEMAPWPAALVNDRYVVGAEATAAAAQAQADIAALLARFAAAGWKTSWKYTSYLVASGGKPKREEVATTWREALKLIGQIEKGTLPPAGQSSSGYQSTCGVCRKKSANTRDLDGQTVCASCAPDVEARIAAERAAIRAALEVAGVDAWILQAPPMLADLLLVEHRDYWWKELLGTRSFVDRVTADAQVQALTPDQRQRALGLVAQGIAWDYRGATSARYVAAPAQEG